METRGRSGGGGCGQGPLSSGLPTRPPLGAGPKESGRERRRSGVGGRLVPWPPVRRWLHSRGLSATEAPLPTPATLIRGDRHPGWTDRGE